jgi:hypothetical protein
MDTRVEQINDFLEYLSKTIIGLKNLIRLKLDVPLLKKFLYTLEAKENKLNKELSKIKSMCPHDWEYGGHGHNDDWYKCTICGKTEDR